MWFIDTEPYLVNAFHCQSFIFTAGCPPLCLLCRRVGHVWARRLLPEPVVISAIMSPGSLRPLTPAYLVALVLQTYYNVVSEDPMNTTQVAALSAFTTDDRALRTVYISCCHITGLRRLQRTSCSTKLPDIPASPSGTTYKVR